MKKKLLFIAVCAVCFGGTYLLKTAIVSSHYSSPSREDLRTVPERIISLAPSVTETMFLLGIGDRLVGTTLYCNHPPEARTVERVGGYSTPDFEKIALLEPDLIIMLEEHRKIDLEEKFRKVGLQTCVVSTGTVEKILDSIITIGSVCGVTETAEHIAASLRKRLSGLKGTETGVRPSVLVTVGKNMGSAGLESVFAAGKNTYYSDLLQILGARNACPDTPQEYVQISGEGMLRSNPDIIIDIVPEASSADVKKVIRTWKAVPSLNAHIGVLSSEYCARPGPSFIKILEDMSREIRTWRRSIQ